MLVLIDKECEVDKLFDDVSDGDVDQDSEYEFDVDMDNDTDTEVERLADASFVSEAVGPERLSEFDSDKESEALVDDDVLTEALVDSDGDPLVDCDCDVDDEWVPERLLDALLESEAVSTDVTENVADGVGVGGGVMVNVIDDERDDERSRDNDVLYVCERDSDSLSERDTSFVSSFVAL